VLEEWDDLNIADACIFVLCPSCGDILISQALLPADCKMGLPGFVQDHVTEKAAEKKGKNMSIKELCSPVLHFQTKFWVSVTFQMNLFTMII
jgi:hypothetical protein